MMSGGRCPRVEGPSRTWDPARISYTRKAAGSRRFCRLNLRNRIGKQRGKTMNAKRLGLAPIVVTVLTMTAAAQIVGDAPSQRAVIARDIDTYVLFAYDELTFKGGNAATNSGYIVGGNI